MSEGKEGPVLTAYHAKALVLHLGDADPEIGAALRAIASGSHVVVPALAALSRAMGTMRDLCMTTVHDEAMDTIESALVEACARPAGKEKDE